MTMPDFLSQAAGLVTSPLNLFAPFINSLSPLAQPHVYSALGNNLLLFYQVLAMAYSRFRRTPISIKYWIFNRGVLVLPFLIMVRQVIVYPASLYFFGGGFWLVSYYMIAILVVDQFLVKKHIVPSATAAGFTVFLASIVWEMPHYYLWSRQLSHDWTILFSLISALVWVPIAMLVNKKPLRNLSGLVAIGLSTFGFCLLMGNPTLNSEFIYYRLLALASRTITIWLLTRTLWGDMKK